MTEKEVNINGIDVSECKHYRKDDKKKPICKSGGCLRVYRSCFCNENIDYDYRKLKRLEQKLNKIKEIATKYSQREDYLLGGLFTDLVDELNEVLKDE